MSARKSSSSQDKSAVQHALPGISFNPVPSEAYIGVDEAGRGCLAGPVISAAVWLSEKLPPGLAGLADSKVLSPARREELAPLIRREAVAFGLGLSWQREIDRVNILGATHRSMVRALVALKVRLGKRKDRAEFFKELWPLVLVDGNRRIPDALFTSFPLWNLPPRQRTLVDGDALAPAISAASILAKTFRDDLMSAYELRYPHYAFYQHKGYATKEHRAAVAEHGPCPLHRRTFAGVAEYV